MPSWSVLVWSLWFLNECCWSAPKLLQNIKGFQNARLHPYSHMSEPNHSPWLFIFKLHTNLEVASCSQHRLDSSHAVIVVVLGWQLLWAQAVHSHNLDREGSGLHKTTGVQGDLRNQGVVWHHHSHCAEEGLHTHTHTHTHVPAPRHVRVHQAKRIKSTHVVFILFAWLQNLGHQYFAKSLKKNPQCGTCTHTKMWSVLPVTLTLQFSFSSYWLFFCCNKIMLYLNHSLQQHNRVVVVVSK